MNDRADLIVQHFNYLVDEYGFRIERKEFNPGAMGDAIVVFTSANLGIEIVIDRNQVLLRIGDQSDPRGAWFEFSDVVKHFAPSLDNVYDAPEKTPERTWDDVVEAQLAKLALVLRESCTPLLRGESLAKTEIKKIEKKRVNQRFGKFFRGSS